MGTANNVYDVLVIGGGATGAGVAVDAASRGLKTALVEKYDFSSGTSSRSTKLIHGGVRYLQKAIMQFDLEQVCFYLNIFIFCAYVYLFLIRCISLILVSHGERGFVGESQSH